jgi:hypothetical protein
MLLFDHLCRLVISLPGYRSREKWWVLNGVRSASWVQLKSYLKEVVALRSRKTENTAVGIRHADREAPSIRKTWL